MRWKKKFITIAPLLLLFFLGITYSLFYSTASLHSEEQNIANFIFDAKSLDVLQLPLVGLKPGDNKEYDFSITNNNDKGLTSEVTIEYQFTIKTYHFVPFVIELYKLDGENEQFIFKCDETYTRNDKNEIICNSPIQKMKYSTLVLDNYKLKIKFPDEYNNTSYSDLVDYVNIEIKSWQKTD